jgi:hypothetical protein
MQSLTAIQAAW